MVVPVFGMDRPGIKAGITVSLVDAMIIGQLLCLYISIEHRGNLE